MKWAKQWWWLIVAVFAIALAVAWLEERCQAQAYHCRASYAAQTQSERLSGDISLSEQAAEQQAIAAACEPNGYFCRLFAATNLPTVLLVLIGVGGVWAALRTLTVIEQQATAIMDADCALFLVLWEDMIHCNPEAPNGTLSHALRWSFQNVGKSPGFLTSAFARFIVIENLEKLPAIPDYTIPKDLKLAHESEPILAGQQHQPGLYAPIESTVSYEELEALQRNGKCSFYAYGRLLYTDIYGRYQESRFGIVWEYLPDRPVRGRFKIAGPRAYNRYKQPRCRRN
jgi:hypothetical protein